MHQVLLLVGALTVAADKSADTHFKTDLTREDFDPCTSGSYQTINSSDRLVGNTDLSSLKCDKHDLIPGWYRFTGDAGDKIPNTRPPQTLRCGTHAPGWIKGSNPAVADGEVTRTVCYFWSGNDCRWNNSIKVKNCGAFYVYELQKPPLCWLRYCGEASECTNYTTLDEADRAVGNTNQSNFKCDRWDPGKIVSHDWYRMTGASGDQIPEGCVPINRCGTRAPGWLNDTHPTVKDGLQRAQVCYHWNNDCCKWKNNITIRNCGSYFVYQLVKPPDCRLRYCGNRNALSTTPTPITRPALDPCRSGNYQIINSSDRLVGNTDKSSFKCDKHDLIPGWYRFTGDAGDKIPNTRPSHTHLCGTHAPGWISGGNPAVADGEVTRSVCYFWSGNDCRWNNSIKVRNCGAFYVYKLQKPPVCWLRYCGEASECTNYTIIDQADRAVGNTNPSNSKCDRWYPDKIVSHDWYRMTGNSGDQIPERCVPINRCGTHAPGWLNDTHPTVKDGLQRAQVCYHWNNDCCKWKNNITIRNCGSYFVYQLVKPPVCHLRYCGNGNALSTTPPGITKPALDPCTSGNYQTINSSDRLVGNTDQSSSKCDSHDLIPGWYRFAGDAGDGMPTYCPPTRRCGTDAPGWLSGSYPTMAEGVVNRKVCYHWSNRCCRWSSNIKIQNCGGYFVYQLAKPPFCHLRYCGNGHEQTTAQATTLSSTTQPSEKTAQPTSTSSTTQTSETTTQPTISSSTTQPSEATTQPTTSSSTAQSSETTIQPTATSSTTQSSETTMQPTATSSTTQPSETTTQPTTTLSTTQPSETTTQPTTLSSRTQPSETTTQPTTSSSTTQLSETTIQPTTTTSTTQPSETTTQATTLSSTTQPSERSIQPNNKSSTTQLSETTIQPTTTLSPTQSSETTTQPTTSSSTTQPSERTIQPTTTSSTSQASETTIQTKTTLSTTQLSVSTAPTAHPPGPQEVNVTCGKNEMWINLPKSLLRRVDRKHLRLLDANCSAQETRTHFILYTKLTECQTVIKHTSSFAYYMNKVLEIPLTQNQIITRVREVEIPFTCYYSNTGVVSAVGIKAQSKKILFSKNGFGKFVLEMSIYPDGKYVGFYTKKDFPLIVPPRKKLFVQVRVDSEDKRLTILADECFATPDVNPYNPGLKYTFIKDGCAVDETVNVIESGNKQLQRYSIKAFQFLGDHEFVYLHCKVKICNATDPYSRCAQGCSPHRRRRVARLPRQSKDEEATLAEGPFMRQHNEKNSPLLQGYKESRAIDKTDADSSISLSTIAMALVLAVSVFLLSCFIYTKKKHSFKLDYHPLAVPVE